MTWIIAGVPILILILLLVGLFLRSSLSLNIAEEEKESIDKESPEQIAEELEQIEVEDGVTLKEEDTSRSVGQFE